MTRKLILASYMLVHTALLLAQDTVPGPKEAFAPGEYLKYRVFYDSWLTSWITAGYGTMMITDSDREFSGRKTWHLDVTGKSAGMFNLFYKVEDRFQSFIDKDSLVPWLFIRNTREGKLRIEDEVYFDRSEFTATSRKTVKKIPPGVQDIVSSFYYMRTMDFDSARENDTYDLDFYLDDSVYTSRIIFLGREQVETELGVFNCLKFKPQVAQGEIFQEPYPMELWVTADRNKVPVLIRSGVYIGKVTIELIEYHGLVYPLEPATK